MYTTFDCHRSCRRHRVVFESFWRDGACSSLVDSSGHVMHAEIRVGNAPLMLADEFPDVGYVSPQPLGGSAAPILVFVEDESP